LHTIDSSSAACPSSSAASAVTNLNTEPGGYVDQHWVRLLTADDQDARIMDPSRKPGFELRQLGEQYEAPGWDLARAVFAAGIYRRA
jgi:hypothetical protein